MVEEHSRTLDKLFGASMEAFDTTLSGTVHVWWCLARLGARLAKACLCYRLIPLTK